MTSNPGEELSLLKEGTRAPDFEGIDDQGNPFRLSSLFPEFHVVLYFYPKDNTPGCTREAEGFSQWYPQFQELGVEIIGISTDSVRSHQRFKEKYQIPYRLIADPEKQIVRLYGVYGPKKRFGKISWGTHRVTYIIDRQGIIRKVYPQVDPSVHAEEVYQWIREHLISGS